ncbi:MAG: sulfonate transporter [Hyphomicrobiales bacterium]|nr:sulfonate transporter [Hyphomicrobiales bacterium]
MIRPLAFVAALAVFVSTTAFASAQDKLIIASGAQGNWRTSPPFLGNHAGIFAKHGLDVQVLWTQGGGETMQAVASGSADIGVGLGLVAVMSAYQKGAPLRPIGNTSTGPDLYWYVPASSPIKSLKDAGGRSIAYATGGSSGFVALQALSKLYGVDMKLTPTGGPAATLTQVMSGQIDIGWANPPFGFEQRKKGLIRVVAREAELPGLDNQTSRVLIANLTALKNRPKVMEKFRAAYAETIDWMYASPDAMPAFSAFSGVPLDIAIQVVEEFWPKKAVLMTSLGGVDAVMRDGVEMKFLNAPLSKSQLDDFFAHYQK